LTPRSFAPAPAVQLPDDAQPKYEHTAARPLASADAVCALGVAACVGACVGVYV
jgi:hypothetical protein